MSVPRLIDAICTAWTKCLPPPYGEGVYSSAVDHQTDCNRFVVDVVSQFNYLKMWNDKENRAFTANEISDFLAMDSDWMEVPGDVAQFHANNGAIVIAAWKNLDGPHGHVCIVRPGHAEPSRSWGVMIDAVPKVANVSEPEYCRIDRKASWAFPWDKIPKYYAKKDMIP